MKKYDLIVVGGGLSGVCASIAASRAGMSILCHSFFGDGLG